MGLNHKFKYWRHCLWVFIRNLVIFFFASSLITVLLYRFVPVFLTPLMLIRCVEYAWKGEDVRVLKKWTPIEEMSDDLKKAVISSEDQNFLTHSGFDWPLIEKAYEQNKKGTRIIGASTISQQTAKNVFLYPRRSYIRKGFEAYFTFLIENVWTKERILEVYLNIAETGHGIYGMPMASELYFEKNVGKLSKSEAATLAALLPSPLTFNPSKQTPRFGRRKRRIMREMDRIVKLDLNTKVCERKPYMPLKRTKGTETEVEK